MLQLVYMMLLFNWVSSATLKQRPSAETSDQDSPNLGRQLSFQYHNHEELVIYLNSVHKAYPHLTKLYSIGKSVQGRDLWVLLISSSPRERLILQPEIKWVGNIHGNEPVGREILLHLIEYLLKNYSRDEYVRWLVDHSRIHILPSMNPDGFESSREGDCTGVRGRYNANGIDLNRDFPDVFKGKKTELQPETAAVSRWTQQNAFVLSAGLHGGALVASYPFDNKANQGVIDRIRGFQPSLTPDDDTFRHLALTYSFNHKEMHRGQACYRGDSRFPNGTTNGAAWYYLAGGMQDYNYVYHGCMELTLELSCCKYPAATQLSPLWEDNKQALLKYMGQVHHGVLGTVHDELGNPVNKATVKIKDRKFGSRTTKHGEYWRILVPGFYTIQVTADGYEEYEETFQVTADKPTLLNVNLNRVDQVAAATLLDSIPTIDSTPDNERPSFFSTLSNFLGGILG